MEIKNRRISSEEERKREIEFFTTKVDTFSAFRKTPEERKVLRKIKKKHKRSLKKHYGEEVNLRKVFNIPKHGYEISLKTRF